MQFHESATIVKRQLTPTQVVNLIQVPSSSALSSLRTSLAPFPTVARAQSAPTTRSLISARDQNATRVRTTEETFNALISARSPSISARSPLARPQSAPTRNARLACNQSAKSIVTTEYGNAGASASLLDSLEKSPRDQINTSFDLHSREPNKQHSARKDVGHQTPRSQCSTDVSSSILDGMDKLMQAARSNADAGVDLKSIEYKITKLEDSLEEKVLKASSDAMDRSISFCTSVEDRLTQKIEALRRDMRVELSSALADMSFPVEPKLFRDSLLKDVEQSISREIGNLRLELQGSLVTDGHLEPRETSSTVSEIHSNIPTYMVDTISEIDSLHRMITDVVEINQSLAKGLDDVCRERNTTFVDIFDRLQFIERKLLASNETSNETLPGTSTDETPISNKEDLTFVAPQGSPDNILEQVMRALEPHIMDNSKRVLQQVAGVARAPG